jgi:hypothetical protein
MAHESVTVGAAAIGLTAATYRRARKAFLTLETAQIRFNYDGTTPTSTVGHLMEVGQTLELKNHDEIVNFLAIRTGSSGTLKVSYED